MPGSGQLQRKRSVAEQSCKPPDDRRAPAASVLSSAARRPDFNSLAEIRHRQKPFPAPLGAATQWCAPDKLTRKRNCSPSGPQKVRPPGAPPAAGDRACCAPGCVRLSPSECPCPSGPSTVEAGLGSGAPEPSRSLLFFKQSFSVLALTVLELAL